MTVIHGEYERDSEKDKLNKKRHGFGFEEILDVFKGPFFLEKLDSEHSTLEEKRFIGIGNLNGIVVVTTVYTERRRKRLISSRFDAKAEEAFYYGRQNIDR